MLKQSKQTVASGGATPPNQDDGVPLEAFRSTGNFQSLPAITTNSTSSNSYSNFTMIAAGASAQQKMPPMNNAIAADIENQAEQQQPQTMWQAKELDR